MFDIELDVLCLVADYDRVEPRVLQEMNDILATNRRADLEIAVIITQDSTATRLTRKRAGETAYVALTRDEVQTPDFTFREALAQTLLTVDHFNVTVPITEPSAFFGRTEDIRELQLAVRAGQHVGVFGLRKAGKSSLLNQLARVLNAEGYPVARIELEEFIDSPRHFKATVVDAMAEALVAAGRPLPPLRTDRAHPSSVNDYWLSDIETIVRSTSSAAPIVLMCDEIDAALPVRTFREVSPDVDLGILRALTQLRGLFQRMQSLGENYPVFVAAGVDPAIFARSQVREQANPLFQFARVYFIRPMNRDELADMVRTLGKRTGMKFRDHALIDALLDEYGGHPLLTRKACSLVHLSRPEAQVPYSVPMEALQAAFAAEGPDTPHYAAMGMLEDFVTWFPEEGAALQKAVLQRTTSLSGDRLNHGREYGLLTRDDAIAMLTLLR